MNHQHITGGFTVASPNPAQTAATFGENVGYNYNGIGASSAIDGPQLQQLGPRPQQTYVTYEKRQWLWVPAGDLRLEASWDITKSFALEAGFEMLYFANGIARGKGITPAQTVTVPGHGPHTDRGNPIDFTNQDMIFTGWTVGFVLNR